MAKYRILTLDGGGIRGILTARLLERIAAERPGFLSQVDLLAGTSTGSILAIGLALGLTPAQLVTLYKERGPQVFADSLWDDVRDLGALTGAQYSTRNRYEAIHPIIGDVRLRDLPRRVLVATFQLDNLNPISPAPMPDGQRTWKAKFFHNYPGPDSDGEQRAIDVIMRSSAAPTYFPLYQGFIDGGVVANNPSMCALAQAIHPGTGGESLDRLVLLSAGTGCKEEYIESRDGDWGYVQWGFKLISLLLESGSGLADYQCRQLLGDRYFRLNPSLKESIDLDAIDRIQTLLAVATEMDLAPVLAWIDQHWGPDD
jgi:patatin-like phospholipase/acyl hydrolase